MTFNFSFFVECRVVWVSVGFLVENVGFAFVLLIVAV